MAYTRPYASLLAQRLKEPRRCVQVVAGARQVGRSTLVQSVVEASGLLWRLSRGGDADQRTQTMDALYPRFIDRNDDFARCVVAQSGGQTGSSPKPLSTRVRVLGPNLVLQQDARAVAGCRQYHHPRPLPGTAERGWDVDRTEKVHRASDSVAWFQPKAAGPQYGVAIRSIELLD